MSHDKLMCQYPAVSSLTLFTLSMQTIDVFLAEAKESLSVRPQSVEEIGLVTQKHAELGKRKPEVEPLFLEAERKNKLLRSVAGGGVEQLSELKTRWDKFEIMMESHQLMIKDQVCPSYSPLFHKLHTYYCAGQAHIAVFSDSG